MAKARPAIRFFLGLAALSGLTVACPALALTLPASAQQTHQRGQALGSYPLPIGPFSDGAVPVLVVEGAVQQTAWRIPGQTGTTLDLLAPLRAELAEDGYKVLFECQTETCGGFDFRFGTEVLPEPDMHVDLGDFRYFAARRTGQAGQSGPDYVSLIVSRAAHAGFVQITRVSPPDAAALQEPAPDVDSALLDDDAELPRGLPAPAGSLADALTRQGAVVLEDLIFATGAGTLEPGDFPSLSALALWLRAHPQARVTLVGHTDASGGLAGNIALSRLRADAVRQALIDRHDIPATQLAAEGVGYLAPRDSNQTEAGRTRNRRVEAILTSTP